MGKPPRSFVHREFPSSWRQKRKRREQLQLPVNPCPYCTAPDKNECSYEKSLKRLGLVGHTRRPKGCLVNVQGELPEGY